MTNIKRLSFPLICSAILAVIGLVFTACNNDDPKPNSGSEDNEQITDEIVYLAAEDLTEYGYLKDGVYYELNHDKLTAKITAVAGGVTTLTPPKSIIFNGNNYTMPTKFGSGYIHAPSVETLKLSARYTAIEPLSGFTALKRIVISKDNENLKSSNGVVLSHDAKTLIYVPASIPTPFSIPASVTTIDNRAITENLSIKQLTIPATVKYVNGSIWKNQFEKLIIESSDTHFSDECFARNEELKEVVLPQGITEINNALFSYCTDLETVNFPEGLTSIGSTAFRSCDLSEVSLPSTLAHIGDNVFEGCNDLKKIYYKAATFKSGSNALNVASLTEIHFTHRGEVTGLSAKSFSNDIYNNCRLFIPKGYASAYAKEPFSLFKNVTEE